MEDIEEVEVESVATTTITMPTDGFNQSGVQPGDKLYISNTQAHTRIPTGTARVLTVIETKMQPRGAATNMNPSRLVTQYWSLDGTLLAEADKYAAALIDGLSEALDRAEARISTMELRHRMHTAEIESLSRDAVGFLKKSTRKKKAPTRKKKATKKKTPRKRK